MDQVHSVSWFCAKQGKRTRLLIWMSGCVLRVLDRQPDDDTFLKFGQPVAQQADDRLGTIMEIAESGEIKMKWDSGVTSYCRWHPVSHIRP